MSGIHLIMPMGGAGSRFSEEGFDLPKPLILLHKRPFFYWAALSIVGHVDVLDITFIVLEAHIKRYAIAQEILKFFPEARIVVIPKVLSGPAHTCIEGVKGINDENPLVFNDCDHCFGSKAFYDAVYRDKLGNGLLTFKASSPAFSYVRYDDSGHPIGTIEKTAASEDAICGAYIFKSKEEFLKYANKYISSCPYNECFMSGIYNVLCEHGGEFSVYPLDWHCEFGTPEEYKLAMEQYEIINRVNEK